MISYLFKSEERIKLLYYIFYRKDVTVTQVSKETGVNKGLVSRYLNKLINFGLIKKQNRKYIILDNAIVRAIKLFLNLNKININFVKYDWVRGIGLFGSWASGENVYDSDIDIWVKTDHYPSEYELAKLQKKLKDMGGAEVNLLVLTPQKIKELKERDIPFYNSIIKNYVILMGESIE